ncbi:ABC transporter permease [Paenibacillus baekrokdamisoli]|uniref:ABC transporter permease n=1 Tax=Paenibacillus baekrokdamisoli TaxID=1712516 RepID=A0A3G9JAS0_9BACL|nr:ABC transporter permease [Paenibacillus baekrokdamisoli]MBB3069709.1 ABC-type nitrate/sulfonate/bicarbonate transport system permease component [Paenibacillus baekrokdamisoli]BBH20938.1 ABC transporter permease [Paenibacillus baekrokdamisoli]
MGNNIRKIWPPVAVMLFLLLSWQAVVVVFDIRPFVLPSPYVIMMQAITDASPLLDHTLATLGVTLLGFTAGAAAGFVLAALLHLIPGAKSGFYPLLVLTQNVPIMALGPLLVLWFGFGILPRVILIIIVCFFPIAVAMLTGLMQSDPKLVTYMRMIGATKRQQFWRLELPNSIPYLFSGLKIAASYSVISAIYAESIGASKGLGYYMLLSRNGFETAKIFCAIAIIIFISLIIFGAISLAERLFLRGRTPSKGG